MGIRNVMMWCNKCTAYKFVDRKVAKLLTEQIWKWIDFSSLYFCMKKQLTELQIPRYKYNIIEDMRDDHAHIYKHCIQSKFDDNYLVTVTKK